MMHGFKLQLAGITCLASLLLYACTDTAAPESKRTVFQFGTLIEISLYDVEAGRAETILDKLEADYSQYHADWTPWQDSPLRQTNDLLQAGETFSVHPRVLPLIEISRSLSEKSHGLFNPSIGGLIKLWQFHKHDDPDIRPPDKQQISALINQQPSMNDLQLDGNRLHSSNPSVDLNFGAFAKGYAIDLSMAYLKANGIHHAVINAGGDLSVSGQHGERHWKIGIRDPRKEGVFARLEALNGESIFTSGDYERFYIYEGQRYHHILDPRNGYPTTETASVTVIHNNAGIADAAATALFIAGPQKWHAIASSMGIKYVMLVDLQGNIHMNPKMAKRIQLEENADYNIVLSEPL